MDQNPIFVYGTLMRGERAFSLLSSYSVHYGIAKLPHARLYASPAGYPLAVELDRGHNRVSPVVWGEVHWLRPAGYAALLARLDHYEGDEYRRQLRSVFLMDQDGVYDGGATNSQSGRAPGARQHALDCGCDENRSFHLAQNSGSHSEQSIDAWVYLSDAAHVGQFPQIPGGNWRTRGNRC
ncbi:MAG TPA: gamma-glutamylcyclotransferase [Caldilineaceae bacterium]|nr:gamma-glutamylcyclotransferase [Caldilineaceae bacterium]